jgi:antitoxin ParD1/3/4
MDEDRETKLQALRDTIEASIARGGANSDDVVGANIDAALDKWEATEKAG